MNNKIKIYVFGNPLLPFDNLPLKLIPELKKIFPQIEFISKDPNENLKPINKDLIIIDTIANADKVTIINDPKRIKTNKIYSAHDFDLGLNIRILQEIGELEKITILGIPPKIKKRKALHELSGLIENYILKSN